MSDKRCRLFHDIMFHVKNMYALLNNNAYKDLNEYFNSIIQRYDDTLLEYDTGSHVVNAIIQDCVINNYGKVEYSRDNERFKVEVILPNAVNFTE